MTTPHRYGWYWPAQTIKILRENGFVDETLRDDCHYRTGDYVTLHEHDGVRITGHMAEVYITAIKLTDKPGVITLRLEEVK